MALNYRRLERLVRGVSCHRRIQILDLLDTDGPLDLITISRRVGSNMKTISEHAKRLFIAGHVTKKAVGRNVVHAITGRGKNTLTFLRTLE